MNNTKIKIALITLGHAKLQFDVHKLKNICSQIFEIVSIEEISNLPDTEIEDGYLDQKFDKEQMGRIVRCPNNADIAVGFMSYRFADKFYMHRVGENCAVVSLHGIEEILFRKSISMDNFVKKQLYEVSAFYMLCNGVISDKVYSLVHKDTRGCLFDLNGDRQDIVFNTESPIICETCKSKFREIQLDRIQLKALECELYDIKKPIIQRLENLIHKYPLTSVIGSAFIAIILNVLASAIWEKIKPVG